MTERIALAYSGSLASSAAVAWLIERHGAEVVTVTVDVGQSEDLDEVRGRALACGAARAHVIDAREPFVHDCVIPALRAAAHGPGAAALAQLADPLIARTLLEVAALEAAAAIAHASAAATFDALLQAAAPPSMRVVAPARMWSLDGAALAEYARQHALPASAPRRERHLLLRSAVDPARAPANDAHVDIVFERGLPVSINGVPMTLPEAIDSLSLIAGQHGVGFADGVSAPAASVLLAAYGASDDPGASVRLTLRRGTVEVSGVTTLDRGDLKVSASR